MLYQIRIGEDQFAVEVAEIAEGRTRVSVNGQAYDVVIDNFAEVVPCGTAARPAPVPAAPPAPRPRTAAAVSFPDAEGGETIIAPIPGLITALKVEVGDWVDAGRTVVVIEAMKMENNLVTHCAGIVKTIHVQKGSQVNTGDPILTIG